VVRAEKLSRHEGALLWCVQRGATVVEAGGTPEEAGKAAHRAAVSGGASPEEARAAAGKAAGAEASREVEKAKTEGLQKASGDHRQSNTKTEGPTAAHQPGLTLESTWPTAPSPQPQPHPAPCHACGRGRLSTTHASVQTELMIGPGPGPGEDEGEDTSNAAGEAIDTAAKEEPRAIPERFLLPNMNPLEWLHHVNDGHHRWVELTLAQLTPDQVMEVLTHKYEGRHQLTLLHIAAAKDRKMSRLLMTAVGMLSDARSSPPLCAQSEPWAPVVDAARKEGTDFQQRKAEGMDFQQRKAEHAGLTMGLTGDDLAASLLRESDTRMQAYSRAMGITAATRAFPAHNFRGLPPGSPRSPYHARYRIRYQDES